MSEDLFNDQIGLFPVITEESYPELINAWKDAVKIKATNYATVEKLLEDRIKIGIIKNVRDLYIVSSRSSPQLEEMLEIMYEAIMHYRQQKQELNLP